MHTYVYIDGDIHTNVTHVCHLLNVSLHRPLTERESDPTLLQRITQ